MRCRLVALLLVAVGSPGNIFGQNSGVTETGDDAASQIQMLETKIAEITERLQQLRDENEALRDRFATLRQPA